MTTTEEALTIECPRCLVVPGQMCIILTPVFVRESTLHYGHTDKSQIGREAKVPHNERRQAFFWLHLPPRDDVLHWSNPTKRRAVVSRDDRYMIVFDVRFKVFARIESLRRSLLIGEFADLDDAKAACQQHSDNAREGVCDCASYEPCYGECCGIGNCTCTPEVAELVS